LIGSRLWDRGSIGLARLCVNKKSIVRYEPGSDKICDALIPDTFQVSGSLAFITRLKKQILKKPISVTTGKKTSVVKKPTLCL
jgi:hypothetical protein